MKVKRLINLALAVVFVSSSFSAGIIPNTTKNSGAVLVAVADEETTDGNDSLVVGDFVPDEEYSALVAQKEEFAENYYALKSSGNYAEAKALLNSANAMFSTNPTETQTFATPSTFTASYTMKRLATLGQRPQQTNFWCGYAAMESLLDYDYQDVTQTQIANWTYSPSLACPWYLSNGNSTSQFPVAVVLTEKIGFTYLPYPYGGVGATTLVSSNIKDKITATIDQNHGVLALGTSRKNKSNGTEDASHFYGYPINTDISHWVAIDGYASSGNTIWIVDPAKSPAVTWSDNISAYQSVSIEKLTAFAQTHGIIW
ncbi:hypothetical protein FACS1894132_01810 [Clostridia bacterium]|nr:hypothetical protein FACS1894132_01810 [Clostridia bacterium]